MKNGHRTYLDPKPHRPTILVNEELVSRVLELRRKGHLDEVRVAA